MFLLQNNCIIDRRGGIIKIDGRELELPDQFHKDEFDKKLEGKCEINTISESKDAIEKLVKQDEQENQPGDIRNIRHKIPLRSEPLMAHSKPPEDIVIEKLQMEFAMSDGKFKFQSPNRKTIS